jgi:predicted DNA-binding protein YlxM (UPF0122 family)
MLKENQMKAIRLYFEGKKTVQEIAEECGYSDRRTIYDLLKRPEAQEYIEQLANEALKDSLRMMQMNSKKLVRELLRIAEGDVKDKQLVYAQLQALNSLLQRGGLSAKNTVVIEENKSSEEDYNDLIAMLKSKTDDKAE